MSASKHVTIWCDNGGRDLPPGTYPGCHTHLEIGETPIVTEARRAAKRDGWRYVGGVDLCPVCAAHSARSTDG